MVSPWILAGIRNEEEENNSNIGLNTDHSQARGGSFLATPFLHSSFPLAISAVMLSNLGHWTLRWLAVVLQSDSGTCEATETPITEHKQGLEQQEGHKHTHSSPNNNNMLIQITVVCT